MYKLHGVLQAQLQRIGLDLSEGVLLDEKKVRDIIQLVSETYEDYENAQYLLERNIELLSDEMSEFESQIKAQKSLINKISQHGLIITDAYWNITFINPAVQEYINLDSESILGKKVFKICKFINAQKKTLEHKKFMNYFECGNPFSCENGIMLFNEMPAFFATFTFIPVLQNKKIKEFIISFKNTNAQVQANLRNFQSFLADKHFQDLSTTHQAALKKRVYSFIQKAILLNQINLQNYDANTTLYFQSLIGHEIETIESLLSQTQSHPLIEHTSIGLTDPYHSSFTNDIYGKYFTKVTSLPPIKFDQNTKQFHSIIFNQIAFYTYYLSSMLISAFKLTDSIELLSSQYEAYASNQLLFDIKIGFHRASSPPMQNIDIENFIQHLELPFKVDMTAKQCQSNLDIINFRIPYQQSPVRASRRPDEYVLKVLFIGDNDSGICETMRNAIENLGHNIQVVSDLPSAIEQFKYHRLHQNEFNVLIFENKSGQEVYVNFIHEVSSYINSKLSSIIFINEEPDERQPDEGLHHYYLPKKFNLKALTEVFNNIHFHNVVKQQSKLSTQELVFPMPDIQIAYIDTDEAVSSYNMMMLEKLTINIEFHISHYPDYSLPELKQDAIVIVNGCTNIVSTLKLVKQIKTYHPHSLVYLIVSHIEDHERTDFLNAGIVDFLLYPYEYPELYQFIQTIYQNHAINQIEHDASINRKES